LYRHPQVMLMTGQARQVVADLFKSYVANPLDMQVGFAARASRAKPDLNGDSGDTVHRVVADYIAGMTDRFAAREHERLTGTRLFL
jgi:dGTPase